MAVFFRRGEFGFLSIATGGDEGGRGGRAGVRGRGRGLWAERALFCLRAWEADVSTWARAGTEEA